MIEGYYGLKKLPFPKDIKTDLLLESLDMKEAGARLAYLKQYRGIFCLTGEPGSGKTSMLRRFVATLPPQQYLHCYTPHVTISRAEIYRQLNQMLRLAPKIRKSDLYEQIQRSILEQFQNHGKVTCIILDECQLMDHATLQELVLLTNFEMDSSLPFVLLLIGQPEFRETLKRAIHEPLKQRISVHYHMAGLTLEETNDYVALHLKIAGRSDPLFDSSAGAVIHQLAHGLPRKIGKLCLAAMNLGMTRGARSIDGDLILQVATEV
jgi:type II secretory pathway predicted ATPase ExeA